MNNANIHTIFTNALLRARKKPCPFFFSFAIQDFLYLNSSHDLLYKQILVHVCKAKKMTITIRQNIALGGKKLRITTHQDNKDSPKTDALLRKLAYCFMQPRQFASGLKSFLNENKPDAVHKATSGW